jgi:hypothetical protein
MVKHTCQTQVSTFSFSHTEWTEPKSRCTGYFHIHGLTESLLPTTPGRDIIFYILQVWELMLTQDKVLPPNYPLVLVDSQYKMKSHNLKIK